MYRIWLKSEQDYERDIDGDVMTFATEREALDFIPHSAARHDISKFDMEVVEDGEVRVWTTKRKLRKRCCGWSAINRIISARLGRVGLRRIGSAGLQRPAKY